MAAKPQVFSGDSKTLGPALLPEFNQEMAGTRKSLERVPDDKLAFTPHPKSMTLGRLATHLASINQWAAAIVGSDSFDVATAPAEPEYTGRAELLKGFDQGVALARQAIANATDEHLLRPWSLISNGATIFSIPRIAVLRRFILNHTIHHRAQLGVYLRLNDLPVPSIYGPSADEGKM